MPGIDKNSGPSAVQIALSRRGGLTLSEQIRDEMTAAIREGRLVAGARVASCRDLAAQLGVARGTVRHAYDMLVDSQLLVAKGAAGTFVAAQLPVTSKADARQKVMSPLFDIIHDFDLPPLTFQMGVPADDAFPAKVWSRILTRHAREMATRPVSYPDPRGSVMLREQLVSYLAMTRGIRCQASQIMITNGYAGALGLICLTLGLRDQQAWIEDPGYLLARKALEMAGVTPVGISVDSEGIRVDEGKRLAPQARIALVTPGQQAPLGMTLSLTRRSELIQWAQQTDGLIVEDDYLGELQLDGRAAPAMASLDTERVLHIGTFSKNLSPSLRLGYLVVPERLASRFGDVTALLSPASSFVLHNAVAEFLREGHFMRHLRRMKRLYAERLENMLQALRPHFPSVTRAALGVVIELPAGTRDSVIAREALAWGMAPTALSVWYQCAERRRYGLVLSVTNMPKGGFESSALRLKMLVEQCG
ncbi:PLP-dependent aminotransferase family protein [Erwinia billingiae]|uniref:MocR-like pyridoxine biosynthesis transcription factor PdxR n=1 Tax=Erwinia billingiae TaxID=182337 RepID=UPI0012493014|nr:PLP-dependent aminotransferase family protein [Erwinia billingiae]QEW34124.1 PLP-dependent aminotransferase family protein [Erwinia billingiae]